MIDGRLRVSECFHLPNELNARAPLRFAGVVTRQHFFSHTREKSSEARLVVAPRSHLSVMQISLHQND